VAPELPLCAVAVVEPQAPGPVEVVLPVDIGRRKMSRAKAPFSSCIVAGPRYSRQQGFVSGGVVLDYEFGRGGHADNHAAAVAAGSWRM
jgi:hypothetical protein